MDDNIIDYLIEMGFTGYEAKVYSSLVTLGRTNATLIAKRAEVPRVRIYDILDTLQRKGWANKIKIKPVLFESISLEKAEEKLNDLENHFKKTKKIIIDELKVNKAKESNILEEDQIIYAKTEKTIKKIKEILRNTKKQIIFSDISSFTLIIFLDDLKKLKRKKIKIQMLIKDNPSKEIIYKLKAVGSLKFCFKKKIQGCTLSDNKIVLNIFEQNEGLYSTILTYKKCLYCLEAWLSRELEEIK